MRWSWQLEPRGVFTLLIPLIGRVGQRQEATIWASLKQLLEAQQTTRPCAQAVIRKPQEFTKMIGSRLGGKASRVGMLGTVALASYLLMIRPRHLRWGATAEEPHEAIPAPGRQESATGVRPRHYPDL